MQRTIALLMAASLLVLGGCPTVDPGGGGGGSTTLKQGIYSGNVDGTLRISVNGTVTKQESATQQIIETISATGLPVLSTGQPVAQGDTIILGSAGANILVGTVQSIEQSNGKLVINYTLSGQNDGITITGTGQTVYTANSDTAIDFLLTLDFSGTDTTGAVVRQEETQHGVLTR